MKKFHLIADVSFDAEDVDDALRLLSEHFAAIGTEDKESPLDLTGGEITLKSCAAEIKVIGDPFGGFPHF